MSAELRRLRAVKALIVTARHSPQEEGERLLRRAEDELEAFLTAPPVIGGDGPPVASCLICGQNSTLAVWYASTRHGVCETCRARAHPAPQPDTTPHGESLEDFIVREARAISGPRTHLQDSEAVIQFGLLVARRVDRLYDDVRRRNDRRMTDDD